MSQMKPKKINNLQSLKLEQERLRMQLAFTEDQLGISWSDLKQNYKGMIWKQINPFKNSSVLKIALDLVQPGLLPVITEVVKGGIKGNPLNLKVLGTSAKYAAANIGIKWLRKLLDKRDNAPEDSETDTPSEMQADQAADPTV